MRSRQRTSTDLLVQMLVWPALLALAASAAANDPPAESGQAPDDVSASDRAVLAAIGSAWAAREVSFRAGELHWSVTRDSGLPAWSDPDSAPPVSADGEQRAADVGRLRFQETQVRFDGDCVLLLKSSDFAAAFHRRFPQPETGGLLRQYTAILDQQWGRHVWEARGDQAAFAFTARRADSLHAERASSFVRPARLLLADATLWGLRPLSLPGRPVQLQACTLPGHRPQCGHQECLAIEERIDSGGVVETRTFWIDPGRDHVIVRMRYSVDDLPRTQLDVEYDLPAGETAWAPSRWTGLQFDQYGQAGDVATAVRTGFQRGAIPESVFQAEIPAGAKQVFPDWERTPHRTFHLEERPEIEERWRAADRSFVKPRSLLRLVAWPWILVTLFSGWAALAMFPRLVRARRGSNSSISWTVLRRQILGIVLASLAAFWFRDAGVFHPSLSEIRQELHDTWTVGRELRRQSPAEAEWNAYSRMAGPRVRNLVRELELAEQRFSADEATSRQQWNDAEARTLLVKAATEHFRATLLDHQQLAVAQETELAQRLDDAAQLLDKDGLVSAGPLRTAVQGGRSDDIDAWIMPGMLMANAALIAVVLFLPGHWRRRGAAADR